VQERLGLGQLGEQLIGAGDEHARVPEVVARRQVGGRGGEIGFLDERVDEMGVARALDRQRRPAADVAEAHRGLARRDADGRDVARPGDGHGLLDRLAEPLAVGDDVVRRERADDDPGVTAVQDGRREADRRRRVLRLALEDDVDLGQLGQLLLHRRAMRTAGHDHDPRRAREGQDPVPGVAQERLAAAREIVQELRASARESGHSREPTPPAGMIAWKSGSAPSIACMRATLSGPRPGHRPPLPGTQKSGRRLRVSATTSREFRNPTGDRTRERSRVSSLP